MPFKCQQESTKLENYMLYIAAKLLEAVRWVAEHHPSPEKVDYLNKKVSEEIVMADEWKAASTSQQKPCWDIFTEANIACICDQVAMHNPTWYHYLYATNLSSYLGGQHPSKMWWLHSILQPSEAQQSAVQGGTVGGSSDVDATMQEPDDSSAPAAEVDALPLSAPSPVRLLMQAAKKGKACIVEEPVKKAQARPVKAAAPAPAPSAPPVAVHWHHPFFTYNTLHHLQLEELNRIEAMINAICNSNGILPETLLGYEHPTSVSPSSQSPSLTGLQMETLHIGNMHSNTSAHFISALELPHKKEEEGEAATPPEVAPVAR
ncbi:hypothetical protein V8E53_002387 [Lactarius tabidus]